MSGSVGPPLLVSKASQRSSARMLRGGNTHDNYHDVIEYHAVRRRAPFGHPPMNSLQNVDVPSIESGGRPLYSPSPTVQQYRLHDICKNASLVLARPMDVGINQHRVGITWFTFADAVRRCAPNIVLLFFDVPFRTFFIPLKNATSSARVPSKALSSV